MVLLKDGLHVLRAVLDQLLADASHLALVADQSEFLLQRGLELLFRDLRPLLLGLLLVDLRVAVVIVELHVIFDDAFEVAYVHADFLAELKAEVLANLVQLDRHVLRLAIALLESTLYLQFDVPAELLKLLLLLVLLAEQVVSLQHEYHLLLRLLEKACQLDANLIR